MTSDPNCYLDMLYNLKKNICRAVGITLAACLEA